MQEALIVGAGVSGLLHALALRSAGVRIAAVFDPAPERARLLTSLVGGKPCDRFADALEIDTTIAAVCSPPLHHVDQVEAVARPGRLVFVEKPIALNRADLERLRGIPNVVPILQWRAGRETQMILLTTTGHRSRVMASRGWRSPRECRQRLVRDRSREGAIKPERRRQEKRSGEGRAR